ncbi:hypothetical protein P9112_004072 [Eukaryota sp. TZLM1-RC]
MHFGKQSGWEWIICTSQLIVQYITEKDSSYYCIESMHRDSPQKAMAREQFHNLRSLLKQRCFEYSDDSQNIDLCTLEQLVDDLQLPIDEANIDLVKQHCCNSNTLINLSLLFSRLSFRHRAGEVSSICFVPPRDTVDDSSLPKARPSTAPPRSACSSSSTLDFSFSSSVPKPFAVTLNKNSQSLVDRTLAWEKICLFKKRLMCFDCSKSGIVPRSLFFEVLATVKVKLDGDLLKRVISDCSMTDEGQESINYRLFFELYLPSQNSIFDLEKQISFLTPWLFPSGSADDQYRSGLINENYNQCQWKSLVKRPKTACIYEPPSTVSKSIDSQELLNDKVSYAKSSNPLLTSIELGKSRNLLFNLPRDMVYGSPYPKKTESFADLVANQFSIVNAPVKRVQKSLSKTFGYSKANRTSLLRAKFIKNRIDKEKNKFR